MVHLPLQNGPFTSGKWPIYAPENGLFSRPFKDDNAIKWSDDAMLHQNLDFVKMVDVKCLTVTARSVPKANLSLGIDSTELVENMGAHRGHSRATTNKNHFSLIIGGEEFTVGSGNCDFIAGLQVKNIR